jgi:homoserine kinase type II
MYVCLRDVHREHVLFTGTLVSGIVDFGAVGIDTVACDLGRLLGSLVPDDAPRWNAAFAHYRQRGELSAQAEQLAWRFDATSVVIGALHWLEWIAIEQRVFADAAAAYHRWEQLVARMERWLAAGATLVTESPLAVCPSQFGT